MAETGVRTRPRILEAAKGALLEYGYAGLSTRRVAEAAGVPLSQIHYHFGSKKQLILDLLAEEDEELLERQRHLYETEMPLWKQWEMACDYFDDDLDSGYARVLVEMIAAGWTDPEVAGAIRGRLGGWFRLLGEVSSRAADRFGDLGPFTPEEVAALVGSPFIGAEAMILVGMDEDVMPIRSALRKIGEMIRVLEEEGGP